MLSLASNEIKDRQLNNLCKIKSNKQFVNNFFYNKNNHILNKKNVLINKSRNYKQTMLILLNFNDPIILD